MTSSSDQSFDCKSQINFDETLKLEQFIARLQEERLKIEAFKRELPLCMHLLTNAMEATKQQLQTQRDRPVLEEFLPPKNQIDSTETEKMNSLDRSNWMASAQLWRNEETSEEKSKISPQPILASSHETEIKFSLNTKQRIKNYGAFHPFGSKNKGEGFPELALASSSHVDGDDDLNESKSSPETKSSGKFSGGDAAGSTSQRKARRCWSPDLHRRFVNALHMLGGSQVATPKQIRELMKVEGLTNDEVKSHLQKYRLHTRRPSPTPQTAVVPPPQVVVLGGIWVPPEYAAAAAHGGSPAAAALYGAHAVSPHQVSSAFCSSVPSEIFPAITQPSQAVHHHQQQRAYNKVVRNSSPESDFHGGGGDGDPSESIEDGKSESGSWKADSGVENGGEKRRLENGDESNASIISLKF